MIKNTETCTRMDIKTHSFMIGCKNVTVLFPVS